MPTATPTEVPLVTEEPTATPTTIPTATMIPIETTGEGYTVQVGAYRQKSNAQYCEKQVKALGYDTYLDWDGDLYRVQVNLFATKSEAERIAGQMRELGFPTYVWKIFRMGPDAATE